MSMGSSLSTPSYLGKIISKAEWRKYEHILQSLGEHLPRKNCVQCKASIANGSLHCSGCPMDKAPHYCSPTCQRLHWDSGHKIICGLGRQHTRKIKFCPTSSDVQASRDLKWCEVNRGRMLEFGPDPPHGGLPIAIPTTQFTSRPLQVHVPIHKDAERRLGFVS